MPAREAATCGVAMVIETVAVAVAKIHGCSFEGSETVTEVFGWWLL